MPSLLSLPPELFSAVLDDVSGRDVMNLRLVCRHTSALSFHQFGLKAAQQAKLPVRAFHVHVEEGTRHNKDDLRVLQEQYFRPGEFSPDFELTITVLCSAFEEKPGYTAKNLFDTKRLRYEFCTLPVEGTAWSTQSRADFDYHGIARHAPRDHSPEAMDHCFREIRIAFCEGPLDALAEFLLSQARTLRVLHLEHIAMLYLEDDSDDVLDFLRMLKNLLSLEYLKMARLSSKDDRSRLIGGHDDTWTSREEIQEGLQMYIQREENDEHSVDEEWGDDDEGEWIVVHHSENEDEEEEVWPGTSQNEDGVATEQPGAEQGEGPEA
ncbi:hypothetical protein KCU98_g11041, partial [Aureobasidium melanogenum]